MTGNNKICIIGSGELLIFSLDCHTSKGTNDVTNRKKSRAGAILSAFMVNELEKKICLHPHVLYI
jgi:hypothetical protein